MDETETALATEVAHTKARLLSLLTEEEQQPRKVTKEDSRVHVWTFEDSANRVIREQLRHTWPEVQTALRSYQHAVNAFWSRVYCDGTPERIYRQWRAKNRALARTIPREDVEAEIVFRLRDAIQRFDVNRGVPFHIFASQMLIAGMRLVEWARQEKSAVQRPRSARRRRSFPFDVAAFNPGEDTNGTD